MRRAIQESKNVPKIVRSSFLIFALGLHRYGFITLSILNLTDEAGIDGAFEFMFSLEE